MSKHKFFQTFEFNCSIVVAFFSGQLIVSQYLPVPY